MSRLALSPSIQQLAWMSMLCCCLVASEVRVTLLYEGLMHDCTTLFVLWISYLRLSPFLTPSCASRVLYAVRSRTSTSPSVQTPPSPC